MTIISRIKDLNVDEIPIDPFWNVGDEKEKLMHRIHAYPAKFPAFITKKAIEYARSKNVEVNVVADIFCGCGTSALEARRYGKDFWGCDINPVATLIAKTKSNKYCNNKLVNYYHKITRHFKTLSSSKTEIDHVNERIKHWFKDDQILDLLLLKKSILEIVPRKSHYRYFFLCAFSNILKPTSMWLTKSIKPQYDPEKEPISVTIAFDKQYKKMLKANKEMFNHHTSKVKIDNINFLNKRIKQSFVDLIITSPPYVTSYEYADLHQLSSLWLDYADDYRTLRKGSIGSLYHESDFENNVNILNVSGKAIVSKLLKKDKRKVRSAAKYFVDMQRCIEKTYQLMNPGGLVLFVIGNTSYKGVHINNAKHLVESLLNNGYDEIEISRRRISTKILTPYRDKKGKFSTDSNDRKVYSEEFIIIGRKPYEY